ncbi:MAG: hypothetical protein RIT45_3007 [Pseudomonadota bacterium]|jgi:hypothetical protein
MRAGIRSTALGLGIAVAVLLAWRWWPPVEGPEPPPESVAPDVSDRAPEPGQASDVTAPSPVDAEAHQAAGRAEPGSAPSGEGEAIRAADGREVGRLWRASGPATLVATWGTADEVAGPSIRAWLAALRRTRDYHLVAVRAETEAGLAEALEAAQAQLDAAVLASALVASGDRAWAAVRAAASDRRWLALALIGPTAPEDALSEAASGLDGRQVFVAAGQDDSAAEAVLALLRPLPLLRAERRGEPRRGLALLQAEPRLQSDLLGWLFAVTPRR